MIKAKTAKRIAKNVRIRDFVKHALIHISYNDINAMITEPKGEA